MWVEIDLISLSFILDHLLFLMFPDLLFHLEGSLECFRVAHIVGVHGFHAGGDGLLIEQEGEGLQGVCEGAL